MKITLELNPITAIRERLARRRMMRDARAFIARRNELLDRAKMNVFEWNTSVVRPTTPEGFTLWVTQSFDPAWSDCIGIGVRWPTDPRGEWRTANFSPARARLIAEHLLRMADLIEEREPSSKDIDTNPDHG